MDTAALLHQLGFTEYEAKAYIGLVRAGRLSGYAVAKASGLPRANVYSVLERLIERGAVHRLETRDGMRYQATAPERLVRRLEKDQQQMLADVREALTMLTPVQESNPVFNIDGYEEFLEQARAVIDRAKHSLLVAIQPNEAATLTKPLQAANTRGVVITTLCMQACAVECGGCQGDIHRYCLAPGADVRWLVVVADDSHMLAGEIFAMDALAVATEQPLIVELAASYIRQSLALATVASELGENFHGLLSEHALKVLDALHPEGGFLAGLKRVTSETTV